MGKKERKASENSESLSNSSSKNRNKKTRYPVFNLSNEFEGDDLRRKVRALLKSFYGYTDDNNPFGDPELSKPFIWNTKIKKMRADGLEPIIDSQSYLLKLKEAKKEIDNIIKSKKHREEIKEAIEAERYPKEEEKIKINEWKEKDKKFHLAQENLRSEIRIMQGREKPIDFINKVLMIWRGFAAPPKDFFEIPEYQRPYKIFEILSREILDDLYRELKMRLQIDQERIANKSFVCFYIDIASNFKKQHDINEEDLKNFIVYWQSMITIIESHLFPEKNLKNLPSETLEEISSIIDNKNLNELDELENLMKSNIEEQINTTDIQFWTNALTLLQINRCKNILDSFYQEFLKDFNKFQIKGEEVLDINETEDEGNLSPPMYESDEELRKNAITEHDYLIKLSETRKIVLAHQLSKWQKNLQEVNKIIKIDNGKQRFKNSNFYEHSLLQEKKELDSDEEVEKFMAKLKSQKTKNKNEKTPYIPSSNSNLMATTTLQSNKANYNLTFGETASTNANVKASRFNLKEETGVDSILAREILQIETKELGDGETIFNDVVPLLNSHYNWASKYKPRKPRFFNRVKTGYEWNKYNQTHYDYENPPPKIIQGYKFNIFYPDLIDKSKSPQYSLERADTADTCIIRFTAGPPYEDIAFKIVNREWDLQDKTGFKSSFDRGILFLYFNFKRYRYKR
jgi:hypothetical protein